jgi:hypothetical protein
LNEIQGSSISTKCPFKVIKKTVGLFPENARRSAALYGGRKIGLGRKTGTVDIFLNGLFEPLFLGCPF